jgi:WhiB family redox-sensing transcriptional regulator
VIELDWVEGPARVLPYLHQFGACRGMDPGIFHPERGESVRPARKVCSLCPVLATCREYAIASMEPMGMWGGMTPRERKSERAKRGALFGPDVIVRVDDLARPA